MDIAQIALLLVVAALMGFAAKAVRQPLLVGYLIAGIGLSLLGFTPKAGAGGAGANWGNTAFVFGGP